MVHQLLARGVVDEVGGAPGGLGVVEGGVERRPVVLLVVAHQADLAARTGEGGHAVMLAGRRDPVGHDVAGLAEAHVAEAGRQREHAGGISLQRTVAAVVGGLDGSVAAPGLLGLGGVGHQCGQAARADAGGG